MKDLVMKIKLIATCLMIYNISSLASQYTCSRCSSFSFHSSIQTCVKSPPEKFLMGQGIAGKWAMLPGEGSFSHEEIETQLSKLDEWMKSKELKIRENEAKAARKKIYEYPIGNYMLQNHRTQYNSPTKRITCYPPKLLLEYKK